jgi:hypothetical protein
VAKLYHLANEAGEAHTLIKDPAYTGKLKELQTQLPEQSVR